MSRTGVIGAVAAFTAAVCMMSCRTSGSRSRDPYPDPRGPIHIGFSCDANNISIGLADAGGVPAWVFKVKGGDPISWEVPTNVTIESIVSKTVDPLPIEKESPNAPQGGSKGTPYKSRAKGGGPSDKNYGYSIHLKCTPTTGGADVPLVIDPVMIVH